MHCSPEYARSQENLHAKGEYGITAQKYGPMVSKIIDKAEIDHLLDYGCGSQLSLTKTLKPERKFKYQGYDIGVPKYSDDPIPADMVTCIDVLEHIEHEYLEDVLDHLQALTKHILFCSIHMGPAGKTLDDGRNAHLTQQPMNWWMPQIFERFQVQTVQLVSPVEFWVLANNLEMPLV